MSKCDCCMDSEDNQYHYWNESYNCEIDEDYTMPDEYACVCYLCFNQLLSEGKIKYNK
jgi:hypothetical protein